MVAEWLDRMRTAPVLTVAQALGLEVQPPRGSSGGAFTCPACNAIRRHTKTRDKRAAAGVRRDGQGWRCFQCDASGDAIDVVALHLRGKRLPDLGDAAKLEIREWCVRWLGLPPNAYPSLPPPLRAPQRSPHTSQPPAPRYPPAQEVEGLWKSASPVTADPEIASWLSRDRGLDAHAIAELDLARALPKQELCALPAWTGFGGNDPGKPWRSWPSVGLRLLVPLYDAKGVMRSVIFRRAFETPKQWPPKSIAASGFERAGLVMANAVACHLLAHPQASSEKIAIVIEEGETDWLTACLAWARSHERAIFGVTSGAWTEAIAQRLPASARVTIRTDNDEAGDRLAATIAKTLLGRCTVLRGGRKGRVE